jgi:cell division protein FtsB
MPVMSALTPRVMSGDLARLYVLEAYIETLKAENESLKAVNESLKRQLAAAETRAARAVITKRLDALAAEREPDRHRSLLRYWFGWRAAG